MLRPDELADALARAADDARPGEPPVEEVLRRARRRYRVKHAALPALAAACVVAIAVPVTLVLSGQDEAPPPPPPADAPVDPASDPRVPDDGDRVRATGVVQLLDGASPRLCAEPALVGFPEGMPCPSFVGLTGLDPSAVDGERATVEGVLRSGAIDVDRQDPAPRPTDTGPDFGPQPPCPAPAGGWPEGNVPYQDTGPDYAGWRDFQARHADLQDRIFQLTANEGRSQVMTFLAQDEAQREQIHSELVALFGADRICSIVSPLDRAQGEQLMQKVSDVATREPRNMYSTRLRYEDGLTRHVADVAVYAITPELAELEQQLPPGAVELHPFLTVVQ